LAGQDSAIRVIILFLAKPENRNGTSRDFFGAETHQEAMCDAELAAVRRSLERGRPIGNERWTLATAERLGLMSTLRPRGRPRVREAEEEIKET